MGCKGSYVAPLGEETPLVAADGLEKCIRRLGVGCVWHEDAPLGKRVWSAGCFYNCQLLDLNSNQIKQRV